MSQLGENQKNLMLNGKLFFDLSFLNLNGRTKIKTAILGHFGPFLGTVYAISGHFDHLKAISGLIS